MVVWFLQWVIRQFNRGCWVFTNELFVSSTVVAGFLQMSYSQIQPWLLGFNKWVIRKFNRGFWVFKYELFASSTVVAGFKKCNIPWFLYLTPLHCVNLNKITVIYFFFIFITLHLHDWIIFLGFHVFWLGIRVMVFNATFNNISVISWLSVLLVEESGVPGENHRFSASHWQTLSHNVVSSTTRLSGIRTHSVSVHRHWFQR